MKHRCALGKVGADPVAILGKINHEATKARQTALLEIVSAELLYESGRSRVRRVPLPDGSGSVICKEVTGRGWEVRVGHEIEVLRRLDGVTGVPRLAEVRYPGAVVLADDGAAPLADLVGARAIDGPDLLRFALSLVKVLAGVHARGVIHRDISPANIIVGDDGDPILIDFDLAIVAAENRQGFAHHRDLIGTLPYLAPEQTGRTGRPVDHRADLYAVGCVLYELASGHPPFGDGDSFKLIRDLLVRIPPALTEIDPAVPPGLSDIVARLLEKEPDRRYQSADGLARDLETVGREPAKRFPLGEWDFPLRLSAPSRLIGRDREIAALRAAFEDSVRGAGRVVFVTGGPGVGKSVLVDELRSQVAAQGGWFVAGKADHVRSDSAPGAVIKAVRGIARLLLADSDAEVELTRQRLAAALGPNTALIAAALPEFSLLLPAGAVDDSVDDPVGAENRLRQALLDLLGAVVSPVRPVVMVLDDLQWADPATLALLRALSMTGGRPGLLVVGVCRELPSDPGGRWNLSEAGMPLVRLAALPADDIGRLLAEMLRMSHSRAAKLAGAIAARTGGNPYETVELVNDLRRDGALTLLDDGWNWDPTVVGRYIGRVGVGDTVRQRLDRLPPDCADLLRMVACLGAVRLSLLSAAAQIPVPAMQRILAPALQDGLLVLEDDWTPADGTDGTVRFPHERVQQAAVDTLDASSRNDLLLAMARRLAFCGAGMQAAQLYVECIEGVSDPAERRAAAALLGTAARDARRISNYGIAERYLAVAADIWATCGIVEDDSGLLDLYVERHNALYGLGRLTEADRAFAEIQRRCTDPIRLAISASVQVSSLTQRNNHRSAADLGLDLLHRLGLPQPDTFGATADSLRALLGWAGQLDLNSDLARSEIDDPRITAAERLFSRLLPSAFFLGDIDLVAWIVLQCRRLWVEHGPSAGLAASLSCAGLVTMAKLQDYSTGYRVGRHVLAVSEARGYEPEGSVLRHRHTIHLLHWAEPLENAIGQAELAREGLLRGGDLQIASHSYMAALAARLECDRSLDSFQAEVQAALTFVAGAGSHHTAQCVVSFEKLVRALRDEGEPSGDPAFEDSRDLPVLAGNAYATGIYHICRSIAAALAGDGEALASHSARAFELRPRMPGYPVVVIYLLRALGAVDESVIAPPERAPALRAELDTCRDWLAARAAEQPHNFQHLFLLVEAERSASAGDFQAAVIAFDEARTVVAGRDRPWHRALIVERTARFCQAHGLHNAARGAITDAHQTFEVWGATAMTAALRVKYAFLGTAERRRPGAGSLPTDHSQVGLSEQLDILAVMRVAEALNAETNLGRLHAVIGEQLTALTGATEILLALRDDDTEEWTLRTATGDNQVAMPLEQAAERGLAPVTAFRYVERTLEPLLVPDATHDDRFSRDSYFVRLERCSLMAVPIRHSGGTRAIVMLTNSLASNAFTADRLGTLNLIAGQLAVSLGNALLHGSLERRVADRTRALAEQTQALGEANRKLEILSVTDALTGVANRRRFADVLAAEWERAEAAESAIGIVLIDIDHFKRYNDHYGHPAGDACLRQVAGILASNIRGSDLLCRYGGEEFAVIVCRIDDDRAAARIAERLRAAVAAVQMEHAGDSAGIVTISVGAATAVPSASLNSDDLVARADVALYRSKDHGRNQITVAARE